MRTRRKRACTLGRGGLEILREVSAVRELESDLLLGLIITGDALSSVVGGLSSAVGGLSSAVAAIQSATG